MITRSVTSSTVRRTSAVYESPNPSPLALACARVKPSGRVDIHLADSAQLIEHREVPERVVVGRDQMERKVGNTLAHHSGRALWVDRDGGHGGGATVGKSAESCSARTAARLTVMVLLPTPPFWFRIVTTFDIRYALRSSGRRGS